MYIKGIIITMGEPTIREDNGNQKLSSDCHKKRSELNELYRKLILIPKDFGVQGNHCNLKYSFGKKRFMSWLTQYCVWCQKNANMSECESLNLHYQYEHANPIGSGYGSDRNMVMTVFIEPFTDEIDSKIKDIEDGVYDLISDEHEKMNRTKAEAKYNNSKNECIEINNTYNMNGPNARVNNQSVDSSTNINDQSSANLESLFEQLRDEIRSQNMDSTITDEALEVVDVIEEQSKQTNPNKTILRSMINGLKNLLPHTANIATIFSMILTATSS